MAPSRNPFVRLARTMAISWLLLLLGLPPCATADLFDDGYYVRKPFAIPADFRPLLNESRTLSIEKHLNVSAYLRVDATEPSPYVTQRNLWIAFRRRPNSTEHIDDDTMTMIAKALRKGWKVYLMGHAEQVQLIGDYFPGDVLSWAVGLIAEYAGAAVADVFRIAALVAFGGVYIDDDVILLQNTEDFDVLISHNKSITLGTEKGQVLGFDCYNRVHHLDKSNLMATYNITDFGVVNHGLRLTQWFIISTQGHMALKRTLENIVELIKKEYLREYGLHHFAQSPRFTDITCATGPDMLTSSVAELMLEHYRRTGNLTASALDGMAVMSFDVFGRKYGAVFKVSQLKHYEERKEHHYYKTFSKRDQTFLRRYVAFNMSHYEGRPVCSGDGAIYLVQGAALRPFPNWDTFVSLFHPHDVMYIRNVSEWALFARGQALPPCTSCRRRSLLL